MVMHDPYTRPPRSARTITVLGGTGFVGHALVNRLTEDGHRLKVLTRNREAHRDMLVHPSVEVFTANVFDSTTLERHLDGADVAINLVGALHAKGGAEGLRRVHVELARKVANACRKTNTRRLLHMSALGAAADAASNYQRTKAEAENLLLTQFRDLDVTVFRPSTIFGENDTFINRFANLLGRVPGVFPLACANARFAPVYVKDVAEAYARALDEPRSFGKRFDLCGPKACTLHEIVEYVRDQQHRRTKILPLPDFLSKLQGAVMQYLPGKPFTLDNYRSLQRDAVCSEGNGLDAFGIEPTGMDAAVPFYLSPRRPRRHYDRFRRKAGGSRFT